MTDPCNSLPTHLVVSNANAAIDFYKKAFGATEVMRMPAEDGKRSDASAINVGGAQIHLMDALPEHCAGGDTVFPPDQIKGTSGTIRSRSRELR